MKAYVGVSLLYRMEVSGPVLGVVDVAATCVAVNPNGSIDLAIFPPPPGPLVDRVEAVRGWSHFGSDPENPAVGTWRFPNAFAETGMNGRAIIAEIMSKSSEWARVVAQFSNMADYRTAYNEARKMAIARDWPELPDEPRPRESGRPCGCDPGANHKCEEHAGVHH